MEAKWYSSAVSCRQVSHCAVTFTVPDMIMNFTHCARISHATQGLGRPRADSL